MPVQIPDACRLLNDPNGAPGKTDAEILEAFRDCGGFSGNLLPSDIAALSEVDRQQVYGVSDAIEKRLGPDMKMPVLVHKLGFGVLPGVSLLSALNAPAGAKSSGPPPTPTNASDAAAESDAIGQRLRNLKSSRVEQDWINARAPAAAAPPATHGERVVSWAERNHAFIEPER